MAVYGKRSVVELLVIFVIPLADTTTCFKRNARSAEHLEKSKVRNAHMKEVWREFHEDD